MRIDRQTLNSLTFSILLLAASAFMLAESKVDPDLWGHILFGEDTVRRGNVAREDIYSYTAPGAPWVNHEWLTEIVMFETYTHGGAPGLVMLKIVAAMLTMAVVLVVIRRETGAGLPAAYLFLHVGYLLAKDSFIRPQLFTCLLFSISLLILRLGRERRFGWFFLFPPVMALWVNMHGGHLAGLGIFTAYALGLLLEEAFGKARRTESEKNGVGRHSPVPAILIPLILAWAATLLNPYVLGLWRYLLDALLRPREFVSDWRPVQLTAEHAGFLALFAVAALTQIITRRRRRIPDIVVLVVSAIFAFNHVRHIPLFAMVAALTLPAHLEDILSRARSLTGPSLSSRLALPGPVKKALPCLCILVALFLIYAGFLQPGKDPLSIRIPPKLYPLYPLRIMKHLDINGNIAVNQFGIGEYLLFHLYPESRVAFDGRLRTVYPVEIEREYIDFMFGNEGWRALLDRYPTDIALIQKFSPTYGLMRNEPDWITLHDGPYFALFLRDVPRHSPIVEKLRLGILELPSPLTYKEFPGWVPIGSSD